jgi:hypothetical protein
MPDIQLLRGGQRRDAGPISPRARSDAIISLARENRSTAMPPISTHSIGTSPQISTPPKMAAEPVRSSTHQASAI